MADLRNGGAAVVETLAAHGVDTVFGIPGARELELYRHLASTGIRLVTPRHEQGGGYAAEGYARVTGAPGVVVTSMGPGLTNVMTAAATAYAESQPLLVFSAGVPTGTHGRDLGLLHETKDARGAMAHLVRWSRRVESPEEAADAVADAFASFRGARPRPVHVEIPVDVLDQPWSGSVPTPAGAAAPVAEHALVVAAAQLLAAAQRPLVVAGGGAVGAAAAITDLAQEIGAPVVTTVNGKGVVDEGHPLAVGASIRLAAVQEECAASDVLLVVGSELGDSDLWDGTITADAVVRVDIEEGQLHKNCRATVALHGDAAATVTALLAALPTRHSRMGVARAAGLRAKCRTQSRADGGRYEELGDALRGALPTEAVLTADHSQVGYLGAVPFVPMAAPRRFCCSPGYAAPGYGLPAAIGAAVARPGVPVAALLGDGAFMFSVQELATAVDLRLALPIVVVDNGGHREVREQERAMGIAPVGVDLPVPDLAALAQACGAHGRRAVTPDAVEELVADALDADRPTVIHLDWVD